MAQFTYKARRPSGELVEGSLDSADKAAALSQIDRLGLFPVSLRQASGGRNGNKEAKRTEKKRPRKSEPRRSRRKAKPPKMQDLADFSRQLANLLNSGMTVTTALGSMASIDIRGIPEELIAGLRQEVMEGKNLSAAMGMHPHIFTDMYINLVRAGEQSGSLVEVLRRLASHYERFAELKHKLVSALVYPAFVLVVGIAMIFFFMFFMMPRFEQIFSGMTGTDGRVELPMATELLMTLSRAMTYILTGNILLLGLLVTVFITIVVMIRRYLKSPAGQRVLDEWILKAPLIGRIARPNLFGQFASTLGALLQNGVPVLTALRITEQVIPNSVISDAIAKTREGVTDGKTIAQPMARSKVFPRLMVDMIHIGEQTGDVPAALHNVAETYESDLMVNLRVVTTLIEPILIVLIALFVGFLLFAVLSAMFSITSTIGG